MSALTSVIKGSSQARSPSASTTDRPDDVSELQEDAWKAAEEGKAGGSEEEQQPSAACTTMDSMTDFSKPINIALESMPGSGEVCSVRFVFLSLSKRMVTSWSSFLLGCKLRVCVCPVCMPDVRC